jgi:ribose transport system permease protein
MQSKATLSSTILDIASRYSGFFILIGIAAIFSLASEDFLEASNLMNIARQTSIIAILAIGMTFVMLTAGIDLSVGSMVALAGALAAGLAVQQELGTFAGIAIALLVGAGIGVINGLLIVWGKLPPFAATLAMLAIARGLTLLYTQGRPIAGIDEAFIFLFNGQVLGISMPVIILAVVFIIAFITLRYTHFGRNVYATGGNEEVSRLAGIPTARITISAYVISGFLAALGGVLLTARLWSAQPNAAVGLELDAIAAPVLGGVSLFGGVGSVAGTMVGAFILGILSNGLNLMEVPSFYQQVIKGVVLVLAVMLDIMTKRRR